MKTADNTRARTAVLQAEWALQNDPERLQDLADRFLALRPLAPGQFVTVADIDHRLPPIVTSPSPTNDDPDSPGEASAGLVARPDPVEPARQVSDIVPRQNPDPAIKPLAVAVPKMAPAPAVTVAIRPTPAVTIAPAPALPAPPAAIRTQQPRAVVAASAPLAVAASNPPRTRYDSSPTGSTAPEVINRIIRSTRPEPSVPAVASVLGAARTILAPPVPVPVASAEAASYTAPR
jgi:hypothetical protein